MLDRASVNSREKIMKYRFYSIAALFLYIAILPVTPLAQSHLAEGDRVVRGNRLISARSEPGRILFEKGRLFSRLEIIPDGHMDELEWKEASRITPFKGGDGTDQTEIRVLYDKRNIYLFWEVYETGGINASQTEDDAVITGEDHIRVDLKPWLPDDIKHARGYYYTIAINPLGSVFDAYFDPFLDGFFFTSWDSGSKTAVARKGSAWTAEMIIPFSGLDVFSDPGWKWGLEFFHGSNVQPDDTRISSANIGITVEQGIRVRRPGLVSYYWPRPGFMEEVKPDLSLRDRSVLQVKPLASKPLVNEQPDTHLWDSIPRAEIFRGDRMGEPLAMNRAAARVGWAGENLCFSLEAEGAKISRETSVASDLGEGMAAQMSGVNGVFVDRAVFEDECFWIILQPRDRNADQVHQDFYHIIVNNSGDIRATHYDRFGAPSRSWSPRAEVDLYDTESGWGVEVNIDISSLNLPLDSADGWGLNVFRNRLLEDGGYELLAWRFTGNDYLNPVSFGLLEGIPEINPETIAAGMKNRLDAVKEKVAALHESYPGKAAELDTLIKGIRFSETGDLRTAQETLSRIDNMAGIIESAEYYKSVPHPVSGGYPIMDLQFIGNNGWAVGALGTVLRSEDGGKSWNRVDLDSDYDFYRVDFVDDLHGWIAGGRIRIAETNESMRHDKRGGYGAIYFTEDGGKTWTCQYGERGRLLFGLDFVDIDTGYACGERGILLKTEDRGKTWKELSTTGTINWLYGLTFRDRNRGFAVGMRETVIKTEDGGRTWTPLDAGADRRPYGFQPIYRDITFNGETGCVAGQNGSLLISHNGGESWKPSATYFKSEIRDLMDLRRVIFPTPKLGYAVGELGTRLMVTEDGGNSWSYRPLPDTEWMRSVWADADGKVVIAGEREKVRLSADRGYSWDAARGDRAKADILVLLAHGDDAPINLNAFFSHYCINEGRTIVEAGVMSDTHSSEYEETYNLEHDRNMWMVGVRTTTNFNEFETGNNGSDYYHYNERLWEGEESVVRHMVAAIRAYRPEIIITHGGVFGDYDKPGHKVSGRAGLPAFETAGGAEDHWPELTRLGLEPWQPKKLYVLASESYPETLSLATVAEQPLKGTDGTCLDFGEYVIRNFQSQGVYHARKGKLSLVKSLVPVPAKETSVFDGLE